MNPHSDPIEEPSPSGHKAGRAAMGGVGLAIAAVGGNLALASTMTLSLMAGMVFALCVAIVFILNSDAPVAGLGIAIGLTLLFSLLSFFISPLIMDLMQQWLYKTTWVSLEEITRYSPETGKVIEQVCTEKKLKQPRLGIIDDQNPTAFTYGSLPNSARLVVSQGLFTYLDDDEVAAVYAHELGHIVHWDFAVMTVASTLVQICYLIFITGQRLGRGSDDSKAQGAIQTAALVAYLFYWIGTYLLLYLSRVREYFADHFSAETTGNPNALSRALVKIAYGLVEEGRRQQEPSRLLEGTRALGIYDSKAALTTGTAYRISAGSDRIGRVFLWDIFNPWGWWMELNSTHPLTGKRIRALTTYAEQLGIATEFDMAGIVQQGKSLSRKRLYGGFLLDLLLYSAEVVGFLAGLIVGVILVATTHQLGTVLALPLIGLGMGVVLKALIMFPSFNHAPETNILDLMSDPYASPLRGQPARLQGELIGRGDAGYVFGSDLQFQDRTGLLYLRYASRFGPIGNFLFGMNRVKSLIGTSAKTLGWFRRGAASWMDLIQLESEGGTRVNSYHRFWSFLLGIGLMAIGICLGLVFSTPV
uniref:Peptidase M48 Ste24p n=1 Tax=Cyanothece sp. (strain PCC 7425 / ATCC 29141) TaxID=395961 RepID=B8HLP8_CYAP4